MTPQELIDTAQRLNPEKFKVDPVGTIQDAYAFIEASKMVSWKSDDPLFIARAAKRKLRMNVSNSLVVELRELLEQRGMSLAKAAKRLGVSTVTIAHWVKETRKPRAHRTEVIRELIEELQAEQDKEML